MANELREVDCFIQLVLAKDSDIWEDMCNNG